MGSSIILEFRKITKDFPGVRALDKVNLKLRKGKVTALMGENGAGKSTIMNILFGIHKKTSGKIIYKSNEIEFHNPKDALNNGVAMVHQELNQVLSTSVVDNIWLGRFPSNGIFVNKSKTINDTKKILKNLKININPLSKIEELSVSERQMVEIAKAISYHSKVLILDEPTSSLTSGEVKHLFRIINDLKNQGVSILFVSHKMTEVFEIADFVTVFRDGKFVFDEPISKLNENKIIKAMVGRELDNQFPKKVLPKKGAPVLLQVKNLSGKYVQLKDVSFELKEGEILGIAGLVGSKRSEILELIFGKRKKTTSSQLFFLKKKIENSKIKNSIKNGFALITEERKSDGLFPMLDIEFNTTIAQTRSYIGKSKFFLNKKLMQSETQNMIKKLDIKTPTQKQKIENLSGGNQQKVILARWLLRQPKVFLMDEPTRGIDVGAKYKIYELINYLASLKKGVIVVSSEMEELLGVCNRIAIMSNGRFAGIVSAKNTSQEEIMKLSAKFY